MKRHLLAFAGLLWILGLAVSVQAGTYNDLILSHGPVSYWTFDESATGTGTAFDSASNNDGTFGGTAERTAGLVGVGAAQFNTTAGDTVNVGNGGGDFAFTTGMTAEALFTTDWAGSAYREFLRKEDSDNRILLSFQAGNILSFGINDGSGYHELDMVLDGLDGRPTVAQIADGNPHHVAATYDAASGFKGIYVDGSLRDSTVESAGTNMTSGGSGAAHIGSYNGLSEPFSGVIDEMALYGNALTPEQLSRHAFDGLGGPQSVVLSTDVLGPGVFPDGYNNNTTGSTVELIRRIPNKTADPPAPYVEAYTQNPADTIDFTPWVVQGNYADGWGSDEHGRGGNLWLPGDGEIDEPHVGFGAHSAMFITFDLEDIRRERFYGRTDPLLLTGRVGVDGRVGSNNPLIEGGVWLDGALLETSGLLAKTDPSHLFELVLPSTGRYLTLALLNGDNSTDWDDATFRDMQLTLIPEPGTICLLGLGVLGLVPAVLRRRKRS